MIHKLLQNQKRLDTVLRQSAQLRREAIASEPVVATVTLPPLSALAENVAPVRDWRVAWWVGGLAVAASLLLLLTPSWFRPAPPTVHAGEFSRQLTTVPGEVLRLLNAAAETSQTRLPQLSPLANLSVPDLPAWQDLSLQLESPMRRELDNWQESWQHLKSRLPAQKL